MAPRYWATVMQIAVYKLYLLKVYEIKFVYRNAKKSIYRRRSSPHSENGFEIDRVDAT